ncbi:MAG: hypothetical protein PHE50_02340 [Dehalococcoidales bacterium]|nr:hypothetical protein [Dehalococcoidales bacterium]
MKVGNPEDTGDLVILKTLCKKYGIAKAVEGIKTVRTAASNCGAGACSNDCTHMCATCYACPDNCSLKA